MKHTRNPLPKKALLLEVGLLNTTVAELTELFARSKQAHGNLRGQSFSGMHKKHWLIGTHLTE